MVTISNARRALALLVLGACGEPMYQGPLPPDALVDITASTDRDHYSPGDVVVVTVQNYGRVTVDYDGGYSGVLEVATSRGWELVIVPTPPDISIGHAVEPGGTGRIYYPLGAVGGVQLRTGSYRAIVSFGPPREAPGIKRTNTFTIGPRR